MIIRCKNFIEGYNHGYRGDVLIAVVVGAFLTSAGPSMAGNSGSVTAKDGEFSTPAVSAASALFKSASQSKSAMVVSSATSSPGNGVLTTKATPTIKSAAGTITHAKPLPLVAQTAVKDTTSVAALPAVNTTPPQPTFQNSPQFGTPGTNSGISPSPQLRGPAGLPSVTIPNPIRKLHVDMGETAPFTWTMPPSSNPTAAQRDMNDVAGGMTPLKVREVLNEALIRSPRVAAARAQLGISKALYAAATQMPDPVFFRDEAPQSEGVRRVGPQVTYEPPWKLAFRLLAAKRQVQETKMEILQQLWQFRNDVRRAYTEVVVAQETYETLHDLSDLAMKLQTVSSKRFQAGDVPELDVLKARLAFSQAEVETGQGNMRINRSRQQLNVIMGRQFGAPISAPRLPAFELKAEKSELLPDYTVPVPPVTDFISEALDNRIEIKINDAQIKLTKARLLNAAGNIIPNPSVAYGGSTETNLPSGPKLNGLYTTINAELPIYNFQQGEIARLKQTMRQFKVQDSAIRNQIIADVTAAYNNLITARNRIQQYQDHVLADSAEVARLARRSYEVGQSDITATLAAQQANFTVRQAYLDAVSSYQQAFTDLEQSIGEPID